MQAHHQRVRWAHRLEAPRRPRQLPPLLTQLTLALLNGSMAPQGARRCLAMATAIPPRPLPVRQPPPGLFQWAWAVRRRSAARAETGMRRQRAELCRTARAAEGQRPWLARL